MSKTVLFGNASTYTTAADPSLLAAGEIGVYSIATTGAFTLITTTCSSAQKQLPIMVAQGGVTGGNFKHVIIYPNGIVSAPTTATSYVAPVPNVYVVGYIGSGSDTIQAGVAGTYNLTVTNTTKGTVPMPFNLASTYYQTAAAATAFQVAYDWAKLVNSKTLNTALYPYDRFVFAHVLTSQASSQLIDSNSGNVTATVVNGSASVTLTSSGSYDVATITAGSYIRIGHATTTTLPVYKITAVGTRSSTSTVITLDAPYVNATLAIGASVSSVACGYLTATPDASDLAGVRLVAFGNWFNGSAFKELQPNTSIAAGVSGNALGTVIAHNGVSAQSYLNTSCAVTTGVFSMGYGVGYQAQKQEFEAQGFQGNMNRSWLPYATQYFAAATSNYDSYVAVYKSFPANAANDGNAKEELHRLILFCVTPATDSGDTLATAKVPTILSSYINA